MPYIPSEVIAKAKEMDLLTYLKTYEPQELVHFSGQTYCTREHDSLKISNGKWCWHSQGIGGRSAIDYLIKVKGLSFTEAVQTVMGNLAIQQPTYTAAAKSEKPKTLLLPKVNRYATQVFNYLLRRGIDSELIHFCIRTGRLYESQQYHNAVFVGMDMAGKPRYAYVRGIDTDFLGDATGSDKHYSFNIPARDGSDTVHLFESAVDLLSYATLLKMHGRDWNTEHLLSLSGVYRPRKNVSESTVPLALTQFLNDHPEIRNIVLRLDNDLGGRIAAETLHRILPEKYEVRTALPPHGKDYNDYLCIRKNLPITKRKEKEQSR